MNHVIVVGNQKGGVGKTTLAVLYAQWFSDIRGQRVCVIDLDTQSNASKTLRHFASAVCAADLFGECVLEGIGGSGAPLTLIAGGKRLADIELARPNEVIPAFCKNIERLAQRFDAIVIDTPPALGLRMSAALIAASAVVCPIELEEYSIDGVTDMLKTIFGVRQRYNPRLQLGGIVLNRFNAHSMRQKDAIRQLVERYPEYVVPARLATRSAIPEAFAKCVSVWALPKSSAREASLEVKALFELLQRRIEAGSKEKRMATGESV